MHSFTDDFTGDAVLTAVFAHRGPFVTVYLDATPVAGSGAMVVDERWAVVRDRLVAAGADGDDLDAIEEVLPVDVAPGRSYGLVAAAANGEVCLRARLDPPAPSLGSWAPLPRLLPYLSARTPDVAHLVVAANAGRARILRLVDGELVVLWPTDGVDRLDAAGVAREVARSASRIDPELVLVSGDAASAGPIIAALAHALVPEVVVRVLPRTADDDGLLRAVGQALRDRDAAARSALLQRVRGLSGDRRRVVTGPREVSAALRMAQVDTLVLADGAAMAHRCWVGARPTEFGTKDADASDVGVELVRHDVIGSALVRAAVATGARLLISRPGEYAPPQAVVALLR